MIRLEVHPGEGGEDATIFAKELSTAIGKYSGAKASFERGAYVLERL